MTAESRLFGTDGVRGLANHYPMTPEMAFALGRAGANICRRPARARGRSSLDVIHGSPGTCWRRPSAPAFVRPVSMPLRVGVLPTPAIAYLTRTWGALGGVVLSASHNPFADNGIKFFSADGFKLPDAQEDDLEQMVRQGGDTPGTNWARHRLHPHGSGGAHGISDLRWHDAWPWGLAGRIAGGA